MKINILFPAKRIMMYALGLSAIFLSGCHHKDFCLHHSHGDIFVKVEYDDDNDPEDAEIIRNNIKASRLLSYLEATGDMVLASDIDKDVNRLYLSADKYNFIAYNAGTQRIDLFNIDKYDAHGATTRECDILEPFYGSRAVQSDIDLGNGEKVVIQADPIWSIGAESIVCNPGDTIILKAVPLHCRYTYEMRNIEGLKGVSRVSSFITGMSKGALLGSVKLFDDPVTVAVPAEVGPDGKSIVGRFFCFGKNPLIHTRHRMGLFIEMENGVKYKLLEGEHFDVTSQVSSASNRRRVHIIIDGVTLPSSDTSAGFEVTLGPWSEGENADLDYNFGNT